jgi:hypothetical protein
VDAQEVIKYLNKSPPNHRLLINKNISGLVVTVIVMLGKFFIAGSFAIIYNYTAELFPTVIRNTALGVGSMCARLSGALTPLIGLLVN